MRTAVGAVLVCGILCFGVAAAKQAAAPGSVPPPQVTTKQAVVLQLMVDEKTPARITVVEGTRARITVLGKQRLALVPTLTDDGLDVELLDLSADPTTGQEVSRQLGRMNLAILGQKLRFHDAVVPIDVQWEGMAEPRTYSEPNTLTSGDEQATASMASRPPCTECCIACDGVRVCSCGVDLACGGCCCERCCYPGGVAAATGQPACQQNISKSAGQ